MSPSRIEAILRMHAPKNVSTLRAFCGAVNYFRRFIDGLGTSMQPLYRLTGARVLWDWSDAEQEAFTKVKECISKSPCLAFLDYDAPIIVRTDASDIGCGAVLLNIVDGEERAVEYCSYIFTDAEKRWATIEKEAYGIFYAVVLKFSSHLLGHHFTIQTDHRNLVYMTKSLTPKVVRWTLRLSEYDYSVEHIPGAENCVADALSRCLVAKAQRSNLVDFALRTTHNGTAGHLGIQATLDRLQQLKLSWPSMRTDVEAYIKSCPLCQKIQGKAKPLEAEHRTTMVDCPNACWAFDTVGPFPRDDNDNVYILTVIDSFSRFVELIPMRHASAQEACRAILTVIGRYGVPSALRSDRGSQYTAQLFQQLLAALDVPHLTSLPYHPQANGLVERANAEVGRHLATIVAERRAKAQWSTYLPLVQRIMNATPSRSTGIAPAALFLSSALDLDTNLFEAAIKTGKPLPDKEYLADLLNVQRKLVAAARVQQTAALATRKPRQRQTVEVGSQVLIARPGRKPDKLSTRYIGPYTVLSRQHDIYKVQDPTSDAVLEYHATRVLPFDPAAQVDPCALAALDDDAYVVESIVDHELGRTKSQHRFLVHWDGYSSEADSWIPWSEAKDLSALDDYLRAHPAVHLEGGKCGKAAL